MEQGFGFCFWITEYFTLYGCMSFFCSPTVCKSSILCYSYIIEAFYPLCSDCWEPGIVSQWYKSFIFRKHVNPVIFKRLLYRIIEWSGLLHPERVCVWAVQEKCQPLRYLQKFVCEQQGFGLCSCAFSHWAIRAINFCSWVIEVILLCVQ